MARLARARSVALCLVVSALALGGIFHLEGRALADRSLAPGRAAAQAPVTTTRARATPVAPAAPVAPEAPAAPAVAESAPVETVSVPNLVGLRLTYAANRIERRGLSIVARDEAGEEVDLTLSQFYRVIGQEIRRGSTVTKGTVIEVRVRDRASSYSDWG